MANQLFVFGDSFTERSKKGWTTKLATKLNFKLKTFGAAGSSIEYSYLKLIDSLEKGLIDTGDLVIFVFTESERLDLDHNLSDSPLSGVYNKISDIIKNKFFDPDKWGIDNQHHIEWYVSNRSQKLLDTKFLLHLSFIKTLSLVYPEIKFLLLPAFETSFDIKSKLFKLMSKSTDNFLVVTTPCLFEISHSEWSTSTSRKIRDKRKAQLQNFFRYEPRINHFSNPTIVILTDAMYNVITNWSTSKLHMGLFIPGILDTTDVLSFNDIKSKFIDTGILDKEIAEQCMI